MLATRLKCASGSVCVALAVQSIQLVMGSGVCACFPQMWIIMYVFET